jgi:hypothetical protein
MAESFGAGRLADDQLCGLLRLAGRECGVRRLPAGEAGEAGGT